MHKTANIINARTHLPGCVESAHCAIARIPQIIERRTITTEIEGGAGRSLRSETVPACGWQSVNLTRHYAPVTLNTIGSESTGHGCN